MRTIRLGTDGPEVSAIGLGCMGMSGAYGGADEGQSLATIEAAIASGINFIDTGDFYGMGHNELLIRRAIKDRRDKLFISVKFGMLRGPSGPPLGFDGRPEAVKTFLAHTLQRLGTDHVDLYQPARVDPAVPIEETVGAVKDMIAAGYVRHLGLSEAGPEALRRAQAVHKVTALQTEYSLAARNIEPRTLPVVRDLGIGLVAYAVLSRGLLGGDLTRTSKFAPGDFRASGPRFQGDNLQHNLDLVAGLKNVASEAGLTPAQLAIGWVLSRGDDIVALIGTRRPERIAEAVAAAGAPLPADVIAAVERAVPKGAVAGERYAAAQMSMVDR